MPAIEWPGLLGLEVLAIAAAITIAYARGRKAVREATASPERRATVVFEFARQAAGLPLLTLFAPILTWWFLRQVSEAGGAGDWLFAVGWTAYVVAWLGVA